MPHVSSTTASDPAVIWLGTYPAEGLGSPTGLGEGLVRLEWAQDGTLAARQVNEIAAPSFVIPHPRLALLYAVSEAQPSVLHVIDPEAPEQPLASIAMPGTDSGCHLLVAPGGDALYVSHYVSGQLSVFLLDDAGMPQGAAAQTFTYQGSGPRQDRQGSAHAHFAGVAPGGRHVVVADLGSDTLWAHELLADGRLGAATVAAALPPGAGPRHFAVRGNLLYVVCELDHQVRTLRWEGATAELIEELPATLVPHRAGAAVYDGHIALLPGATNDVLLVSVRGADVVSVFDVFPEGQLRYRAALDVGHWPRHFAVAAAPDGAQYLVVVNEKGHEVRAFALADVLALEPEGENGAVAVLPDTRIGVTSPACVCPAPR